MTNDDRMAMLRKAVQDLGSQAKVGKRLGYSSATVSQVLSNSYLSIEGLLFGQECP